MAKNPLKIMDTILRDAHQSQAATRMRIEDMLPACELLDNMGYWSIECWGGATFDACLRFLNEDPWERLRTLKKAMPKTPLQMLLRRPAQRHGDHGALMHHFHRQGYDGGPELRDHGFRFPRALARRDAAHRTGL